MTPLEDTLRGAFRAKADEVRPDVVAPLRLPARRRRSFSLAHGGGERKGASARRGWLAPAACAVLVAAVAAGSVALSRAMDERQAPGRQAPGRQLLVASATQNRAAAWLGAQLSRTAVVSCDPVMCQVLRAHGIPAGHLEELQPRTADPFGSAVIVATAAVRREFGTRLSSFYAPAVIASFGSGSAQIDVREVAPDGAAAYRAALSADLAARKAAGTQLTASKRILFSVRARRQLRAGLVDSRLLITIAVMSAQHPVAIVTFGDPGPGASAGLPFRSVDLAQTDRAATMGTSAYVHALLAFLRVQSAPYRPAQIETLRLPSGQPVLRVEFSAPSPVGLLGPHGNGGA